MIPVRVEPGAMPKLAQPVDRFADGMPPHHPLVGMDCPACGDPIEAGQPVALVLVGRSPGSGWTAGSVAVHTACATAER